MNICNVNNDLCHQTLAHTINNKLMFSRKKLFVIPSESITAEALQEKRMEYFDNISELTLV